MDISDTESINGAGTRIYRLLLGLYPAGFRAQSGPAMIELFTESLEAARVRGKVAVAVFWCRTLFDVLLSAPPEHLRARRRRHAALPHKGQGTMRNHFEALRHDLRYAARMLARSPLFTFIAAVTVALGIGATTTIFSVANAILLRPLPGIAAPGKLFTAHRISDAGSSFHAFGWEVYREMADGANDVADLAAFNTFGGSITVTGDPQIIFGLMVSANYFDVVGARAESGRLFLPEDDSPAGDPAVVVLGHRAWLTKFGGDRNIVGTDININGRPMTVIGIAEEGFMGHTAMMDVAAYVPLMSQMVFRDMSATDAQESLSLETLGRLRGDATVDRVTLALNGVADRLVEGAGDTRTLNLAGIDVRRFSNLFAPATGPVSAFMALLLAISGLVLLIASVNVANMLLARASGRVKEIALRQALGAGRWRIVRQMLTESIMLFLAGGAMGIVLTYWTTGFFATIRLPIAVPFLFEFSPDLRVMAFTLSLALATGVAFGLTPALRAARTDLSTSLNSESGGGTRRTRLRDAFVVAQVAGTALLLVTSGLFLRSLESAGSVEVGFDPTGLGVAEYDLLVNNYTEAEGKAFWRDLTSNLETRPNVEAAAVASTLPLSMSNSQTRFRQPVSAGMEPVQRQQAEVAAVGSRYFDAMRIQVRSGRVFGEDDTEGSPQVTVVNQELADRVWPGESAIGQRLDFGRDDAPDVATVVGVVANGKYRFLGEDQRMMVYRPASQVYMPGMSVIARVGGSGTEAAIAIKEAVGLLDRDMPAGMSGSMEEVNGIALIPNRIAATIATVFGGLGMLLAAVGLYGVLAYSVSQRTREIGVRMALGAASGQVRRMVIGDGVRLTAIGLVIGLGAAFGLTRFMEALLYGVSPVDPLTFGTIGLMLMGVAVAASYMPAHRATQTDPMRALRYE